MWRKYCVFTVFIINVLVYLTAFEVVIDRLVVTHQDENYVRNVNLTVRRLYRKSPYLIFTKYYIATPMGNNVSIFAQIFENLSGRYRLVQVNVYPMKWKMCDFFENEPFLGQMLAKQFRQGNYTCPFPIGTIDYPAIEVRVEKFPYFWAMFSVPIKVLNFRFDVSLQVTDTEHKFLSFSVYSKIIQNTTKKSKGPPMKREGFLLKR